MNYIEFAENERLSTIVLGMMRISQMSEDEVEALVEAALSIGINTFDLADIYGDGQCEVLLGKVLKRRPDLGFAIHDNFAVAHSLHRKKFQFRLPVLILLLY